PHRGKPRLGGIDTARASETASCDKGPAPLIRPRGRFVMATSLYDLSVANYLQTLAAVVGFLDKGLEHFTANKVDLGEVVETRLVSDMLPFRFQLQSVAHHSL